MEVEQFFTAFNNFNRFVSDIFNRFIYQILLINHLIREILGFAYIMSNINNVPFVQIHRCS